MNINMLKKCKSIHLKMSIAFICLLIGSSIYSDEATTSQNLTVTIPQIAMIDVNNTVIPLLIVMTPMTDAGDNFATTTATSAYDVTSNISGLSLYGNTNVDLVSNYNLKLEVNESGSFYQTLTTTPQRVSTQGRQAQKNQPLNYRASPAISNKTISHGLINTVVTYTLVEQ